MEYTNLIAITGMSGLYEVVTSKTDGAVVTSLEDGSTRFVSSRIHQFSHLESIEIYTIRENVNLVTILQAMSKSSESIPSEKDNTAIKTYFQKVYPEIDFDRVYISDMKKMVKWFNQLTAKNIELKLTEDTDSEE